MLPDNGTLVFESIANIHKGMFGWIVQFNTRTLSLYQILPALFFDCGKHIFKRFECFSL